MEKIATVILKPGKELAIRRFHPWVFSGAIQSVEGNAKEGSDVRIVGSRKEFLGLGHWLGGSLAVKIYSFEDVVVNDQFWHSRIKNAYEFRKKLEITSGMLSDACRLVFSEGDRLPGLIIDYYNGVAVIQTHTIGMHKLIPVFAESLKKLYGQDLRAVYNKSSETMLRGNPKSGILHPDGFIVGESDAVEIHETGHKFMVDFIRGQKTGFFLDQRSNRLFAQFYARDRKVLNACCYSGAFSVYAMKGGAASVTSVDSSAQAISWTAQNLELNNCEPLKHREVTADIKSWLSETSETFDLIILDPPAFAKSHQVSNNALHAYIRLNAEAMKRLNPGGLLITFSCSQPVSREMFRSAIQSAAIETGRRISLLHQLSQGSDHPVDACHPEGEYLKGLILGVGS
jgi:23S rRNA (cytosine1962-C5)-methyltransferase